MTTREQAIQWFNEKDTYNKSELSHKYYKDSISYNFTALTGREIEEIWRKETQIKNIYLNRLEEQYRKYKESFRLPTGQDEFYKRKDYYDAMRLFCLDTQLVSFNDIEAMECEVNQSFS